MGEDGAAGRILALAWTPLGHTALAQALKLGVHCSMVTTPLNDPRDKIIDLLLKRQRQLIRLVNALRVDIRVLQDQLRQANELKSTSCAGESGLARPRKATKSAGRVRS